MVLLFSCALLVGSGLMFVLEPMCAKMVLPALGGAPAVWNTCVVFYQATLLAGYVYAHYVSARLSLGRQVVLHVGLLLVAAVVLPIGLNVGSVPTGSTPVPWLLGALLVSVGPPFFALSANSSLLQRWFAFTSHPAARDPFFLYASSNVGSMVGLLAFPALLEPSLRLGELSRAWTAGYVVALLLVAYCGAIAWRTRSERTPETTSPADHAEQPTERIPALRRLSWALFALIPSSLLLSVTSYLTADIAPIPLLWVIPLAVYLLSFVVVFGRRYAAISPWASTALVILGLPLASALAMGRTSPMSVLVVVHLATFFAAALLCHGRVAADRPSPARLTEFYLWVSVGGVVGGILNTFLAPLLFRTTLEYPLGLLAAFLVRRSPLNATWPARHSWYPSAAIGAGTLVVAAIILLPFPPGTPTRAVILLSGLFTALIAFGAASWRKPGYTSISVGVLALIGILDTVAESSTIVRGRNFFGTYKVSDSADGRFRRLHHGNTLHGVQALTAEGRTKPVGYYDGTGPLGDAFRLPPLARGGAQIAVLGLGAGGMACYARRDQEWTFFEINPDIEMVARNPRLFTFLSDCAPNARVVLGDARLSLALMPDGAYDVIALDVFSSDAIPIHLLTRDALALYLRKLRPDGVLFLHISNRYLDLVPVVAALARDAGVVAMAKSDTDRKVGLWPAGKQPSIWAVIGRNDKSLRPLASMTQWKTITPDFDAQAWTDDFSNLFSALRPALY